MQTKTHSFIESLANVIIGYVVALLSQIVVFPLFGIDVPLSDNLLIGLWFTAISIIRSYVVRRYFNKNNNTPCLCFQITIYFHYKTQRDKR